MIFQTLDDKRMCPAVYVNGTVVHDELPEGLTGTWSYSSFLGDLDIEYASLYCAGKSLDDVCPGELRPRWERASKKLKAFLQSFTEAKIDLNQNCFYDLVPESFLIEFCEIKNDITNHVLQNFFRPKNYRFLLSLTQLVEDIKQYKLNLDFTELDRNLVSYRARQFKKKIEKNQNISYNVHGTKTGRLTTKKDSFPILTLDKSFRSVLKPHNDWLIELDFNAAEIRTFLALIGQEQPEKDIHAWLGDNVFEGKYDRDMIKKKVFAWLYNPNAKNKHLDNIFDKSKAVLNRHENGVVENPYGRKIESDDHHALNYLIQSTSSDILLRRMVSLADKLKGRKTHVAFSIHDSVILDFCDQDRDILMGLIKEFSKTELGDFKVNVSVGKDFGNMKALNI